ncbi:MAG: thioredoxin family protein [Sciscionella sp.]
MLVDVWTIWCGPCRTVSLTREQLATERAGQVNLVKVDLDSAPGWGGAAARTPAVAGRGDQPHPHDVESHLRR